ncbi:unnamed protein product, partial [Candidula unifasciata]
GSNDVYQFLSGVPITPQTRFLQLSQPDVLEDFQKVIHYMRFALAVYGWPVYVMVHPGTWCCRLLPLLRCCCCKKPQNVEVVDDNCCLCNFSTAKQTSGLQNLDLVYCTYHVDIGETPFFVALDHVYKKVVVAVRGTLSLQDVLTDLKAEPENLPINPPRDDWQGHKGMIQAAVYIKKKLINDGILQMAWDRDEAYTNSTDWLRSARETAKYDLVLVGHSLGAGTAAILAILLKADYPNLHCYSYSPPGGLLTLPCVEATKSFITSVVVGKDCVPRIGLPQLEMLRADILNHIKNTNEAKWKIIFRGLMCCGRYSDTNPADELLERDVTAHPSNSAIGLSAHMPLYPPGQMIHVVRSHIKDKRTKGFCSSSKPIYQAVWASNGDFDEVLVSPTMVNDHMPDNVLEALEKVVMKVAPEKPVHTLTEDQRREMLSHPSVSSLATPTASEVNNSSERTQNAHGSEDSTSHNNENNFNGNGEALIEEDETSALFGMHRSEIEDLVRAPLASPETLSLASGVTVFSPSSSILGRESLKQSLPRCVEKQMDSSSETPDSSGINSNKNHSYKESRSVSQASRSSSSKGNSVSSALEDAEATKQSESDDYKGKLKTGNTISVTAEVVNEMMKQNVKASPLAFENEETMSGGSEFGDSLGQRQEIPDFSTAVLEPSSHTHVISASCQNPGNPAHILQNFTENINNGPPCDLALNIELESDLARKESEDGTGVRDSYTRHSPLESNQHEYAHPNIYYSQAGIGYPHNAFHPPMRFYSFPDEQPTENFGNNDTDELEDDGNQPLINTDSYRIAVVNESDSRVRKVGPRRPFTHAESESNLLSHKRLLPKMKRSAEQDDIVHLCDALEVFENEEDKVRLCQSSEKLNEEELNDPPSLDEDSESFSMSLSPFNMSSKKTSLSFDESIGIHPSQVIGSFYGTETVQAGHSQDSFDPHEQQLSCAEFEDMNCTTVFKVSQKEQQAMNQDENTPLLINKTSQETVKEKQPLDSVANVVIGQGNYNSMQETHL